MAFRRFIARRGRPSLIVSDNATQFVAAAKLLGEIVEELTRFLNNQTITWRFIPQLTPWAGGFYERLVGTTKKAFKNTIGRKTLNYEEALTIFTEVESVVNCRPLTYVHDGPNIRILRPIDLIGTGSQHTALFFTEREEEYTPGRMGTRDVVRKSWEQQNSRVRSFYEQLSEEYLPSLRYRTQQEIPQKNAVDRKPQVGDVVHLLNHEEMEFWPLAKIIHLPGRHPMQHRVAEVKTGSGSVFTRPLTLLAPLEADLSEAGGDGHDQADQPIGEPE
ncbi:Integrase core domain containing protein, partial [Aphelenchoides avenae]